MIRCRLLGHRWQWMVQRYWPEPLTTFVCRRCGARKEEQ